MMRTATKSAFWGTLFAGALALVGCGGGGPADRGGVATVGLTRSALDSASFLVSAYAVDDQSACGRPALSFPVAEVNNFLSALPPDFASNITWQDGQVWTDDWWSGTDYYTSTTPASGYDGADAPTIDYVSTHGWTSGGVYGFAPGASDHGGCNATSDHMQLGTHNARYLFLSTCDSLKIGTGTNPHAAGEDPFRTWHGAVAGVRCIFGYSGPTIDSADYGTRFWVHLASGETLASAFLDASSDVHSAQIAAVLCFGSTSAEARANLAASSFVAAPTGHSAGSWRWRGTVSTSPIALAAGAPHRAAVQPAALLDAQAMARLLPELAAPRTEPEVAEGTLPEVAYSDGEAVKFAQRFLLQHGLLVPGIELAADSVRTDFQADSGGPTRAIAKIVVFRQRLSGAAVVGPRGEVRVTLDSQQRVRALYGGAARLSALTDAEPFHASAVTRERALAAMRAKLQPRLVGAGRWDEVDIDPQELSLGFDPEHADGNGIIPLEYHAVARLRAASLTRLYKLSVPARPQ